MAHLGPVARWEVYWGTRLDSIAMPQQVRTISKLRLLERIGVLTDESLQLAIENRLLEHLGIAFEAEDL